MPPRLALTIACLAVAVITLLAYLPTLSSDFVRLDDYQYVVENERVRSPSWSGAWGFVSEVTHPSTVEGYYQPLTMLSLMLDALLAGAPATQVDPFVFHLTNVLLHAANGALVFLILHMVVGGIRLPLIFALVFALHPVQVESVAWISQRKTVLATALAAGSLLCYLIYASSRETGMRSSSDLHDPTTAQTGARRSRATLAASFVLYILANLAKPTVMLLPLVLPLLDLWPLRRGVRAALGEKWPFFVMMLVIGYVAVVSQTSAGEGAGMAVARFASFDLVVRWIGLLSYNLMLYAGNVFWPVHLSPFRDMPADLSLANPVVAASVLSSFVFFLIWIVAARRWHTCFVGLGAAAIMLAPALGPVRFMASLVADRFLYLPMIFLLLPAVEWFRGMERGNPSRATWIRAVGVIGLVPLMILTRGQQDVWRDSKSLWSRVAEIAPNLDQAPGNLANLAIETGSFDEALELAERAHSLSPDDARHLYLLGRACIGTGEPERGLPYLRRALELGLGPAQSAGHVAVAEAMICLGRDDEAIQSCEQAIAGGYPPAACYLAVAEAALRFAQDCDRASSYYRKALDHDPENLALRWNLATALDCAGKRADALEQYEEVRRRYQESGVEFPNELKEVVERLRRLLDERPADGHNTSATPD